MNCADAEILICDLVDGSLTAEAKAELERHLSVCPACADLARDSAAAVAFMERAADVEAPPELVTRLLFEAPWKKVAARHRPRTWLGSLFSGLLQPRFAMGMAMTVISFSMLARYVTPVRQLRAADLEPAKVWMSLEGRAYRAWARTVKFYENLKFVYQIETTLQEWQQSGDEQPPDDRKLPVRQPGTTGGAAPEGH
jgi:anti-sigma factor RsiW